MCIYNKYKSESYLCYFNDHQKKKQKKTDPKIFANTIS